MWMQEGCTCTYDCMQILMYVILNAHLCGFTIELSSLFSFLQATWEEVLSQTSTD